MKRNNLKDYLRWLITPQDENEAKLFKKEGCVDDYIWIESRIDSMSDDELIEQINIQLSPYKLQIQK